MAVCDLVVLAPQKPRGKRKTQDPCEGCFLHKDRCICQFVPRIELKTKLALVIHAKELKRTTNTGTLAAKALVNSEIFIRGKVNEPLDFARILNPQFHSVLFYPCEEAIELSEDFIHESLLPLQLIVPDGNWRQAGKIHYRYPELQSLPRVMIKTANTESRHLRAESTPEGMATLQAIAHAMGILEGDLIKKQLLELYQLKLEHTLQGRPPRIS